MLSEEDKNALLTTPMEAARALLAEKYGVEVGGPPALGIVQELVALRRLDIALLAGRPLFTDLCRGLYLVQALRYAPGQVELCFSGGAYHINFYEPFSFRMLLIDRLIHYIPYIARSAALIDTPKTVLLELDDGPEGDCLQMVSSGYAPNHVLVPDSSFLASSAYAVQRNGEPSSMSPWTARQDKIYWRGSLTGSANSWRELLRLPRVKLAFASLSNPDLDVRLVRGGLGQYGGYEPYLSETFEALSLLCDLEPHAKNLEFRYVLDVDGNTNSWPGLFIKMLFANTIFKLRSPYRQWYYHLLKDGEHLFYVDALEEDLRLKLAALRAVPRLAEEVGKNARVFASGLTIDSEFPVFLEAIARADLNKHRAYSNAANGAGN
jgi:Glycosyl transferase family 90